MKVLIPIFILPLLILGNSFTSPKDAGDKKSNSKDPKGSKKTVLIVGIKDGNLTSNYFMAEHIAERTSIAKDSLEEVFSREISKSLSKRDDSGFHFIRFESKKDKSLLNKVQYKKEKDMMVSDLSQLNDEDYQQLLSQYNADYVLFLDQYYLKYEGGSNLFHIFNYDIYNQNKKNIVSGKTFFNTAELLPLANYEKKYEKSGNKIIDQLQKASE